VTRYERTQIGYLTICILFGATICVAVMAIVVPANRDGLLISATIEVIFLICAIVFSKLTIKIDGETLRACFAMGSSSRRFPWRRLPHANRFGFGGGTDGVFTSRRMDGSTTSQD